MAMFFEVPDGIRIRLDPLTVGSTELDLIMGLILSPTWFSAIQAEYEALDGRGLPRLTMTCDSVIVSCSVFPNAERKKKAERASDARCGRGKSEQTGDQRRSGAPTQSWRGQDQSEGQRDLWYRSPYSSRSIHRHLPDNPGS